MEQALKDVFGTLPRVHRAIVPSLDDSLHSIFDDDLRDLSRGPVLSVFISTLINGLGVVVPELTRSKSSPMIRDGRVSKCLSSL